MRQKTRLDWGALRVRAPVPMLLYLSKPAAAQRSLNE